MTSQLALMNKNAIALASDSAVTIGGKTYNSATKIFTLKGNHPIGFMIAGAGVYLPCNIDWERVIGLFGDEIGDVNLPTVEDYVVRFKKFLFECPKLKPNQENSTFIQEDLIDFLKHYLKPETKKKLGTVVYDLENLYQEFPGLDEYISKSMNQRIDHFHSTIEELITGLDEQERYVHNRIKEYHKDTLDKANNFFCEMHNVSSGQRKKTHEIISYHLAMGGNGDAVTNLVIAGFGSKEISPVLVELKVKGIVDPTVGACDEGVTNFIRIRKDLEDTGGLEHPIVDGKEAVSAAAFIIPYAQKMEIQNILDGVHMDLQRYYLHEKLPTYIRDATLDQLSKTLSEIDGIGPSTQAKIIKGFHDSAESLKNNISGEISRGIDHYRITRRGYFRDSTRLMSAGQLAEFAKKLVSMEAEITYYLKPKRTVGGEILVATITKEHGFEILE
jgi:hypothetical protein